MADPIRIPNWVNVLINLAYDGQQLQTGWNFRALTSGIWTGGELNVLAQNFWTAIGNDLRAVLPATLQILSVIATDMNPGATAQGTYNLSSMFGTVVTETTALNVAQVLSWRTGLRGRTGRGRTFIPDICEVDINVAKYNAQAMVLFGALAVKYLAFANSGGRGVHAAVASRKDLKVNDAFEAVITNIPDSMRTRLQGRGR